jgi:hypothetical protein
MQEDKSDQNFTKSIFILLKDYLFLKAINKVNEKIDPSINEDRFCRAINRFAKICFALETVLRFGISDCSLEPRDEGYNFLNFFSSSLSIGLLYNFVKNFSLRSYEDSDQESKRIESHISKIHEEIRSKHLRSTEQSKQKYLSTITNPQGELLQDLGNQNDILK